ncbi:MAG TPA: hypothetical protein VNB90_17340 [Cytophagaceae bacterium]|jgi:hypothetical protein|nr:hypothetical protein [Cytophagaceae bacterium]
MKFHEKSLELNITHELLNLADSWYWFLTDIPLWRYWRPRHRLPFLKFPRSISGGFHIKTEGKDDPTGEAGGGYDVRIKTGAGNHLLFIQYKKGELVLSSPDPASEFATAPHDHFEYKINSTKTNQHFTLRNLADGIGKENGNAVVYAFPLIADMKELEDNAGKLIRKTKFVSIADIDLQASLAKVTFVKNKEHCFRIGKFNMNRCEVNFFFFFFYGTDRTPEIIADIIALGFSKTLKYFIKTIETNYKEYRLSEGYIPNGLRQAFIQYIRYLLHYFEVSPSKLNETFREKYVNYFEASEFAQYDSSERDVNILSAVFTALTNFEKFIDSVDPNLEKLLTQEIPQYEPKFLIRGLDNGIKINFENQTSLEQIESINYISI